MLLYSMLVGAALVEGYKEMNLMVGDGTDCNSPGTYTSVHAVELSGLDGPNEKSSCFQFPEAWNGELGAEDAYKSFKVECTKGGQDGPLFYSAGWTTTADCAEGDEAQNPVIPAKYVSGTCFENDGGNPVKVVFSDDLIKACADNTDPGTSSAAGLVGLVGFVTAVFASFL